MRNSALIAVLVAACGPSPGSAADAGGGSDAASADDAAVVVDAPPTATGPVDVVITADNAYSFGYGTSTSITHFTQGQRAQTAGQIFNCPIGEGPEVYTVPEADAPDGAFLYIVTWDDLSVTQGVLGQFTRDQGTLYTGDPRFQVCATGIDFSTGPNALVGPTQAEINAQIAICNAGSGDAATTSKGWVNSAGAVTPGATGNLAIGEANDAAAGGTFPPTCAPTMTTKGIDVASKWMWYTPGNVADAFHSTGSNTFKAYLIFRLGVADIVIF